MSITGSKLQELREQFKKRVFAITDPLTNPTNSMKIAERIEARATNAATGGGTNAFNLEVYKATCTHQLQKLDEQIKQRQQQSLPRQQQSLPRQQQSLPRQQQSLPRQQQSLPRQQQSLPRQQQAPTNTYAVPSGMQQIHGIPSINSYQTQMMSGMNGAPQIVGNMMANRSQMPDIASGQRYGMPPAHNPMAPTQQIAAVMNPTFPGQGLHPQMVVPAGSAGLMGASSPIMPPDQMAFHMAAAGAGAGVGLDQTALPSSYQPHGVTTNQQCTSLNSINTMKTVTAVRAPGSHMAYSSNAPDSRAVPVLIERNKDKPVSSRVDLKKLKEVLLGYEQLVSFWITNAKGQEKEQMEALLRQIRELNEQVMQNKRPLSQKLSSVYTRVSMLQRDINKRSRFPQQSQQVQRKRRKTGPGVEDNSGVRGFVDTLMRVEQENPTSFRASSLKIKELLQFRKFGKGPKYLYKPFKPAKQEPQRQSPTQPPAPPPSGVSSQTSSLVGASARGTITNSAGLNSGQQSALQRTDVPYGVSMQRHIPIQPPNSVHITPQVYKPANKNEEEKYLNSQKYTFDRKKAKQHHWEWFMLESLPLGSRELLKFPLLSIAVKDDYKPESPSHGVIRFAPVSDGNGVCNWPKENLSDVQQKIEQVTRRPKPPNLTEACYMFFNLVQHHMQKIKIV